MATNVTCAQERAEYDVSAIIVNYNGARVLPECLHALRSAARSVRLDVILVDNGSTDGSAEVAERSDLPVRIIRLGRNTGFAAANNAGARAARGRHFLLLNSDCFVRAGLLEVLMRRLDSDRKCAVVGPRLLNPDGSVQPSCHNFPTPLVFFLEQSMLWRLARRVRALAALLHLAGPHDRVHAVDWLVGACLMLRPEAFSQVHGFDDAFFFYWEEADLCFRLRQRGWRVVFDPGAEAVHLGGGSTTDPAMLLHFFRSLYRFYQRHFSHGQMLALRALVRLMALFKAIRCCLTLPLRGQAKAAPQSARAWLEVARL